MTRIIFGPLAMKQRQNHFRSGRIEEKIMFKKVTRYSPQIEAVSRAIPYHQVRFCTTEMYFGRK